MTRPAAGRIAASCPPVLTPPAGKQEGIEIPLELAKLDPHVGRQHTNGCYGARYELRAKGLLVDCAQCDRALTHAEARACKDKFCKANVQKVGFA